MEEKKVSVKAYVKEKIRMLQSDFHIRLTPEEIAHLKSLTREIDVDHAVHTLFNKL